LCGGIKEASNRSPWDIFNGGKPGTPKEIWAPDETRVRGPRLQRGRWPTRGNTGGVDFLRREGLCTMSKKKLKRKDPERVTGQGKRSQKGGARPKESRKNVGGHKKLYERETRTRIIAGGEAEAQSPSQKIIRKGCSARSQGTVYNCELEKTLKKNTFYTRDLLKRGED